MVLQQLTIFWRILVANNFNVLFFERIVNTLQISFPKLFALLYIFVLVVAFVAVVSELRWSHAEDNKQTVIHYLNELGTKSDFCQDCLHFCFIVLDRMVFCCRCTDFESLSFYPVNAFRKVKS